MLILNAPLQAYRPAKLHYLLFFIIGLVIFTVASEILTSEDKFVKLFGNKSQIVEIILHDIDKF